jgi:uncharacterized protein (DUF2236 family)
VLTSLRLYEAVAGRLSTADREAYWTETRPIAALLGIPMRSQPDSLADLERHERAMLERAVRPDEVSRRVGRDVLRPFGGLPTPFYWPSDALAAALVPPSLREPFGLRYRLRERIFFALVIAAVRIGRTVLPDRLTVVPQARRFERGTGGAPR